MAWDILAIRRPPLRVRRRGEKGFEIENYDYESEYIAYTLANTPNKLVHFFTVFSRCLKTQSYESLLEPLRGLDFADPKTYNPARISASNSPLFLALCAFRNKEVRALTGPNKFTSPLTLSLLSSDPLLAVRRGAWGNPTLPLKDVLRYLHNPRENGNYPWSHPLIPIKILLAQARRRDPDSALWIAHNPNCTPELNRILFDLMDTQVHRSLAEQPNVDPELLREIIDSKILNSPLFYLRLPTLPFDIFEQLLPKLSKDEPLFLVQHAKGLSYEKQLLLAKSCPPPALRLLKERTIYPQIKKFSPSTSPEIEL